MRNWLVMTFPFAIAALISDHAAARSAAELVRVKPAEPRALQTVSIDVRVADSCAVRPSVRMSGDLITVVLNDTGLHCDPPAGPLVWEVSIGSFPAGSYRVELRGSAVTPAPMSFTVAATEPRSIDRGFDQTGIWWDPRFPGTGLTVNDALLGRRVVSFSTHEPSRSPVVYSMVLESGQVEGTLYRAAGTPAAANPAVPGAEVTAVGRASLLSLADGKLRFIYTVDPYPRHRLDLERFPF